MELLAKFRPTKIAIEDVPESKATQTNYEAFLKGEYTLRANESEQIGFRSPTNFSPLRSHRQTVGKGLFWLFMSRTDPFLDPIRDDPRFKEAMKKLDPQ